MIMSESSSSCRITRRAAQQGVRTPEVNQSGLEKLATGLNLINNTTNFASKCKDKRCKTCPLLNTSHEIVSNTTGKKYSSVNNTNNTLGCKSQNVVYLLTCVNCNVQYVGETCQPLSQRMNSHRSSTTGCEHKINHVKTCTGCKFSIQIIEKLQGSGYDELNDLDPEQTSNRLIREDFWIKRLRTLYPYGLNEKALDKASEASNVQKAVGRLYPPIDRHVNRPVRSRVKKKLPCKQSALSFFEALDKWYSEDPKKVFNNVRKVLDHMKKRVLREIVSYIIDDANQHFLVEGRDQCYHYIVDIIDTKLFVPEPTVVKRSAPKNICIVQFANKGMDDIRLPKIFRMAEVKTLLPELLQSDEDIPTVTMKLTQPIRNKILNYKATVQSINIVKEQDGFVIQNLPPCDCEHSPFKDAHHNHIVSGDLRLINNKKLRALISKGPNYRENRTINYKRCKDAIILALDKTIPDLVIKYKLDNNQLDAWRAEVLRQVNLKVQSLKVKKVVHKAKPVLKDQTILSELEELHAKYVLVPIDKAANNIAIICKRFYMERIFSEIGLSETSSDTYERSSLTADEVIQSNAEICKTFNLEVPDKFLSLPCMYWLPKMHKTPSKSRFIIASSTCSTKPISTLLSIIFKKIFNQVRNFHQKCYFYKNYNRFWVVENSKLIIDRLNKINAKKQAKEISTFDFSTLYTTLPHTDLVNVLCGLVEFVFRGGRKTLDGNRKYLTVRGNTCFFTRKKHKQGSFTQNQIKMLVKHLITETFFVVGNMVFRQCIGIPMGIDPAPFWANLYLYHYENKYVTGLIKEGTGESKYRGCKFKNCARFIDDEINLNDSGIFGESHLDIYPPCLELKCEHRGIHATFLELDITVVDGIFVYKLFDKRDDFPFDIVRMPDLSGNIPQHVFYGSVMAEFLRIARASLLYKDFIPRAKSLYSRMCNQGAVEVRLLQQIRKLFRKHGDSFLKFDKTVGEIREDILSPS